MTGVSLGARPADNPDELALFADGWTSLSKPVADRFREACWQDALDNCGDVNPNHVREVFLVDGELSVNPRQYSALWSKASAAADGYLDIKVDGNGDVIKVGIAGEGSKGNTNKDVPMRRWRGWISSDPAQEMP